MKHFNQPQTIEELKKQYRQLAKKYHPDLNSYDTTTIMKEINNEYDWLFEHLKHTSKVKADKSATNDHSFKDIISELIKYDDLIIDIVGSWIWLSGNTYPIRKEIKAFGFRWSRSNKKWYLGDIDPDAPKRRKAMTWDYKTSKYGLETLQTPRKPQLT